MIGKNLKSRASYFRYISFTGFLLASVTTFSQQNKAPAENTGTVKHSVVIIPFKPTMLMSDIGKAVNAATNLNYNKIAEAFRYRMDLALYNSFRQSYTTHSILQETKKADTTLGYIYSSIGYNYDLIPGPDSSGESHAEFDPKLQKQHFIQNGQLQVPVDYSKRFMNVIITDPELLPYLADKYSSDIFIFINELDIKNVSNPVQDLNESSYRREITVHYSILNTRNQYLLSGILTTHFPYSENDPKVIGERYFAPVADSMRKELTLKLLNPVRGTGKKTNSNHTKFKDKL